ncbi:LOW QUALITY PROTEIN: hypothetical protein HID58_003346, partial [Brassica napus]
REVERQSRSSWSRRKAGACASVSSSEPESCLFSVSSPLLPCLNCDSGLFHDAWRFVVWSEDAIVEKVLCGGEVPRLDKDYGRGRLLQLCHRRYSPGGGDSFCSAAAGSVFREGEAYLTLPSSYSLRRVEANTALRCRLETRRNFGYRKRSLKKIELFVDVITDKKRYESDDAFDGGPPEMKTVVARGKGRRKEGPMRGGDDQVEAMCDACRSEGVDATTWHAASLLDASIPADVGRVYVIWAVGPFKVFRE